MLDFLRWRAVLVPFLALWGAYFLFLALGGYTSVYPNFQKAVIFQAVFVAAVCLPMLALPFPKAKTLKVLSKYDKLILISGLAVSTIALVSLSIDRLFVQHIDYTEGVCSARYQLTRLGTERVGVSSPFSVIGQLFGFAYFVPVTLVLVRQVSRKTFWLVIGYAFLILMLQVEVASSRSPIILFAVFVMAAMSVRLTYRKSIPEIKLMDVGTAILFAVIGIGFILAVFNCRATASHMTAAEYAKKFASFLGAAPEGALKARDKVPDKLASAPASKAASQPHPAVVPTQSAPVQKATSQPHPAVVQESRFGALMKLTILYATHSAYTFAGIISSPPDHSSMLLNSAVFLLNRVGLHVKQGNENTNIAGRFPSAPGALYHDLGVFGVIFGALLLGILMWGTTRLVSALNESVIILGITSAIFSLVYISPLMLASNFTVFPFICFSFIAVPIFAYLVRGVTRNAVMAPER